MENEGSLKPVDKRLNDETYKFKKNLKMLKSFSAPIITMTDEYVSATPSSSTRPFEMVTQNPYHVLQQILSLLLAAPEDLLRDRAFHLDVILTRSKRGS